MVITEKEVIYMDTDIIIPLIVVIFLTIIVIRFVAKVFLKAILILLLAATALYMFIKAGII